MDFFAGVPDSLLKDFCAYVFDHTPPQRNIIAANEGNAVALAVGYHLATARAGMVYMQNSGQGNAVNPLISLADEEVYRVPLLLLIGWRAEPGVDDEPQHRKQGKITLDILKTLGIGFAVLPSDLDQARQVLGLAVKTMKEKSAPFALVVRKDTFGKYALKKKSQNTYAMSREDAIAAVVGSLGARDIVVCTTGKASRELFESRDKAGSGHGTDFLTVGSMGHASGIALGIALSQPERNVICLDGDGALIMHMGALALIGSQGPANFRHIVLNNGAHESVGGQPTVGFHIDICAMARACGYRQTVLARTKEEMGQGLQLLVAASGPALLEVRLNCNVRQDLGRPTTSPLENKHAFMDFIREP